MTRLRILAYIICVLTCIISSVWVISEPSYEPLLALLGTLTGLIILLSDNNYSDFNTLILLFERLTQNSFIKLVDRSLLQLHKKIVWKLYWTRALLIRNSKIALVIILASCVIIIAQFTISYIKSSENDTNSSTISESTPFPVGTPRWVVTEEAKTKIDEYMNSMFMNCNGKRYVRRLLGSYEVEKIEYSNVAWVMQARGIPKVDREENKVEWLGVIYLVPIPGEEILLRTHKEGTLGQYSKVDFDGYDKEPILAVRKTKGNWIFWIPEAYKPLLPPSIDNYSYKPLSCAEAANIFQ